MRIDLIPTERLCALNVLILLIFKVTTMCSMVVFEDGLPKKKDYRSYNVNLNDDGSFEDDTAAMKEVLTRRFTRLLAEEQGTVDEGEK